MMCSKKCMPVAKEITDKRKIELFDNLLGWISDHVRTDMELIGKMQMLGFTDEEIQYEVGTDNATWKEVYELQELVHKSFS